MFVQFLNVQIGIEADSAQEAYNKLMDVASCNGLEITSDKYIVEDSDEEKDTTELFNE